MIFLIETVYVFKIDILTTNAKQVEKTERNMQAISLCGDPERRHGGDVGRPRERWGQQPGAAPAAWDFSDPSLELGLCGDSGGPRPFFFFFFFFFFW